MFRHEIAAVAAALAVVLAPPKASSQQPTVRSPKHVAATVAMVEDLPVPGVSFVVQRRPGRLPGDLILVRANATPAELSDAVRTLATARAAGGDYPITREMLRIRPQQNSAKALKDFPWTPAVLARLHKAKPRMIEGVGSVRAVAIWLPRQVRSRGAIRAPNKP